ncbi:MAG: hypothetical protein IKB25_02535 [Lentisphaeria bacterium]|nr:hypothetical protein [Lentisphaeria bacterium]
MNQTIKGNTALMIFFSIVIFGIMSAVALGALHKAHNPLIMMPFSILFFLWGIMPFFSWKRTFSRAMTMTPKGIEFQLKPGKVIFLPWSDIQAVGMGANATVYLKDRRKLVIFWAGIGVPDGCQGYPVFKAQSPEINALKPRPWLTPLILLGVLYIATESRMNFSPTTKYIIIAIFTATALYRIGIYLRDYIARS